MTIEPQDKEKLEKELLETCSDRDFDYKKFKIVLNKCVKYGADLNVKDMENSQKAPLHFLCKKGKTQAVKDLVKAGADINSTDKGNHWTGLQYALWDKNSQTANFLLSKGADIENKDYSGWKALHVAAYKNVVDVGKKLIKKGADPDEKDDMKRTPLILACYKRQYEFASFIIGKVKDKNAQDEEGWTAFHHACSWSNEGLIDLLFDYGVKKEIKNNEGKTPADLTYKAGYRDLAKTIKERIKDEKINGKRLRSSKKNNKSRKMAKEILISNRKKRTK